MPGANGEFLLDRNKPRLIALSSLYHQALTLKGILIFSNVIACLDGLLSGNWTDYE